MLGSQKLTDWNLLKIGQNELLKDTNRHTKVYSQTTLLVWINDSTP